MRSVSHRLSEQWSLPKIALSRKSILERLRKILRIGSTYRSEFVTVKGLCSIVYCLEIEMTDCCFFGFFVLRSWPADLSNVLVYSKLDQ